MADGNNPSMRKKKRPTDRGLQFSFNRELPQESRLLGIKERVKMAKTTSSTENADLMEALLLAFEEKMERKGLTSSQLSLSPTGSTASPYPSLVSTPSTTRFSFPLASSTPSLGISLPSSDAVSPVSPPHAEHTPQRMQITTPSAENDPIYLCSEGALRTLYFFFVTLSPQHAVTMENSIIAIY